MAASMPPLDMGGDLEGDALMPGMSDASAELEGPAEELDPMFAADISEVFPDLNDEQLIALQRAVRGLMAMG